MDGSTDDEDELIERARRGDEEAFRRLAERYGPLLWKVTWYYTHDRQLAEDAMQEALLAAWRFLDKYDGRARFSTWLYAIAKNAAIKISMKKRPVPIGDSTDLHAAPGPTPDGAALGRDAVRAALEQLPPEQREAVQLLAIGMSYAEIATIQRVPENTVKKRIWLARGRLRKVLLPDEE